MEDEDESDSDEDLFSEVARGVKVLLLLMLVSPHTVIYYFLFSINQHG